MKIQLILIKITVNQLFLIHYKLDFIYMINNKYALTEGHRRDLKEMIKRYFHKEMREYLK